jgi:putative Mn2+ efflux pump MntP
MASKLNDLLFLIGLFLVLIGGVVLGTYFSGLNDLVQNIHVNLLGGSLLVSVGGMMIVLSFWNNRDQAKTKA